jgi:hypothetical protein
VEKATVQAIADVFKQMMNDSDDRHRSLREQAIVDTKQFAWSRVGQIMYNKLNELVNGK